MASDVEETTIKPVCRDPRALPDAGNAFQRAIQEACRRGAAPPGRPEPPPMDELPDCRVVVAADARKPAREASRAADRGG